MHLLPNSLTSFLSSDVISWRTRFLLLAERFRPKRRHGGDESIDAFVRRRVGRELAETLADAFVTGIHAGDPKLLSVQAALPRLAELEREYGSVLRGMAAMRDGGAPRPTHAANRLPLPDECGHFERGCIA